MSDASRDRDAIIAALNRYAEALDGREWELLEHRVRVLFAVGDTGVLGAATRR